MTTKLATIVEADRVSGETKYVATAHGSVFSARGEGVELLLSRRASEHLDWLRRVRIVIEPTDDEDDA